MATVRYTEPFHVDIDVAAAGDTILVAGQANMEIVMVNFTLLASNPVNVTIAQQDGTALMGRYLFTNVGGMALPDSNVGWTRAAVGQNLVLNLSANVQVGGSLTYRYVPEGLMF